MDNYELLTSQLACYPAMQPEDCIKLLYQSYMGSEHAVNDIDCFVERLAKEMGLPELEAENSFTAENIGHGLCRLHLSQTLKVQPATLAALCILASRKHVPDIEGLREALLELKNWKYASQIGWPQNQLCKVVDDYLAKGCPAIHHSSRYRELYRPHYRLVGQAEALFMPMFAAIDKALRQKAHVLVGIDGMSGAGKSTLCALLQQVYGCGVVHTDDFFLQPHQRTPERLAAPGGNIDYERLAPVASLSADDRTFTYVAYNCQTQRLDEKRVVPAGQLTVMEGVYSLHPKLNASYDVRVFLSVDTKQQAVRIIERGGEDLAQRFFQEWIPMENRYFAQFGIRQGCDVVLDTSGL